MRKDILKYTQNRELSWLKFNQRVLEEAQDPSVPLLERMKFVAIFTSNLDEFFMIRVGSLFDMAATDPKTVDSRSGMTPAQQLEKIYEAVAPLYKERDKTYGEIKKQLHPYGVCGLDYKELEQSEKNSNAQTVSRQLTTIVCILLQFENTLWIWKIANHFFPLRRPKLVLHRSNVLDVTGSRSLSISHETCIYA